MHKIARVQLPDLQVIDARIDFSVPVLNSVIQLCKDLGIRHPEELSLKRYITPEILKKGTVDEETIRRAAAASSQQDTRGKRPEQIGPGGYNPQLSQSAQNISSPTLAPHGGFMGGGTDGSVHGSPTNTPMGTLTSPHRHGQNGQNGTSNRKTKPESVNATLSWGEGLSAEQFDQTLVHSPRAPAKGILAGIFRPTNYEQKAALNRKI